MLLVGVSPFGNLLGFIREFDRIESRPMFGRHHSASTGGDDNDVYDTWRETGEAGVSANGSLRSGAPCSGAFLANKGSREREEGREDAYRETRAIINVWFTSVESK